MIRFGTGGWRAIIGDDFIKANICLLAQAIAAERYFTGHEQNEDRMTERIGQVYANLCARKDNLVLIGMPAVGKTTVGEALAARTGRPFYDTDRELQKRIGSVPDFLKRYGEPAFREAEVSMPCAARNSSFPAITVMPSTRADTP